MIGRQKRREEEEPSMAVVVRVKRSLDEEPLEALVLSCKKRKTNAESDDSVTAIFKFAGTLSRQVLHCNLRQQ